MYSHGLTEHLLFHLLVKSLGFFVAAEVFGLSKNVDESM